MGLTPGLPEDLKPWSQSQVGLGSDPSAPLARHGSLDKSVALSGSVSSSVNDRDPMADRPVSERCCEKAVREGREVLGFHWMEGLERVGNDGACSCPGGAHDRLLSPLHEVK